MKQTYLYKVNKHYVNTRVSHAASSENASPRGGTGLLVAPRPRYIPAHTHTINSTDIHAIYDNISAHAHVCVCVRERERERVCVCVNISVIHEDVLKASPIVLKASHPYPYAYTKP